MSDRRLVLSSYKKLNDTFCWYCGERRTCFDHVPPIALTNRTNIDAQYYLVPACHECNGLLSDHFVLDLQERQELVRQKLRECFKELLSSKLTIDDALSSLDEHYAVDVFRKLWKKEKLERRLTFSLPSFPDESVLQISKTERLEYRLKCIECGNEKVYTYKPSYDAACEDPRCARCRSKPKDWICSCRCNDCKNSRNHTHPSSCETFAKNGGARCALCSKSKLIHDNASR